MSLQPAAHCVQVRIRQGQRDVAGEQVQALAHDLGLDTGSVRVSRLYALNLPISIDELTTIAPIALADGIVEAASIDTVTAQGACHVLIGRQAGVTDDEGRTAQQVLATALDRQHGWPDTQHVFAQRLYDIQNPLTEEQLVRLGTALGNRLVDRIAYGTGVHVQVWAPLVVAEPTHALRHIDLNIGDLALMELSRANCWHLNLVELKAIRSHFAAMAAQRVTSGLASQPTECEMEILAQTWSEHCKHKEFNADIDFFHNGTSRPVHSLFKTFIRGATEVIRDKYQQIGQDWMLTVFSDNAGVVELDADHLFVLKVETHNSPSALDPVGGAMTGVLGNNRDAFGTGKGGARLLFNTNVLCFGPQDYAKPLLSGQLHPARIARGVVHGVEQAGNKSGVPTVNGAIVFDERFSGKPLVFCGTGAIMPRHYPNGPSWQKDIAVGDHIVVIGGRVGRDGIHGATFSSGTLDDKVSSSVVQIGSPFVQKMASDFMTEACALGLVSGCTDNGAGGLSSSVGELAQATGGAAIELAQVPLKYMGLQPWEILLSESQERMTLAVRPADLGELLQLARRREVEATAIGMFNQSGELHATYAGESIARLSLNFLHNGVPQKHMLAEWTDRAPLPVGPLSLDLGATLLALLARPNICSREAVIRQYDHEVKGKTVVKPLMGRSGLAPQDAAVVRAGFTGWHGVAVSSALCPKFGDLDPYAMACGAFDEAIRALVAVGVRLPLLGEQPSWSACDNFCVPNSAYDPVHNPDGKQKLGKLVRMCEALYDMSTFFDVPMTSGKDSMKNDFVADGVQISVPPTVLFTLVARMPDVRTAVTSEFKYVGDQVFLVGATYDELGGSELLTMLSQTGGAVPAVRKEQAKQSYLRLMAAHAERLVVSAHDCSDGGLAVALAECCIGGEFGAAIDVAPLGGQASLPALVFGESHSRIVVSVRASDAPRFAELLDDSATLLGQVTADLTLCIHFETELKCALSVADLTAAWRQEVL
ncbi:MAG: phosphoribosylformylglycinamidine synthase [Myxococcales bacterium]|nr:phosphoribosylformylglycinamidine synthase [Myxococcales bacterium]